MSCSLLRLTTRCDILRTTVDARARGDTADEGDKDREMELWRCLPARGETDPDSMAPRSSPSRERLGVVSGVANRTP